MAKKKGVKPRAGSSGFAADKLVGFIERIERLEQEKRDLATDIGEVYTEAKAAGFVPKIMRKIVALRRQETADRQEEEALLDLYRRAVGLDSFAGTPLGAAAADAADGGYADADPPAKPARRAGIIQVGEADAGHA